MTWLLALAVLAVTSQPPCGTFTPPIFDGIEGPGWPACGIGTCFVICPPMPGAEFTEASSYARQNAYGGWDCASQCRYRASDARVPLPPSFGWATSLCPPDNGANVQWVTFLDANLTEKNGGDRGCWR